MSQSSKLILPKQGSRETAMQNLEYIRQRKDGEIASLQTKFPKLNKCLMGGIEFDTITCISALSGAGKSTLSKCVRDSITTLNPNQKFKQYIFNFEMLAHQQIARSIVAETKIPLKNLYSVEEPLSEKQYEALKEYYEDLAKRDIDFIEVPNTPENIVNSIVYYWENECKKEGKTIIYELDHALLVKGREGQSEKERVDALMYLLVDAKKYIASNGGHSVGIVLSQMNREIRNIQRVQNQEMHRPDTSCLFGASSIEQCSDYILFSHIPAKLGIQSYTTHNLPTRIKESDGVTRQMVYFELVKQRSGQSDLTIPLWNRLHTFDFDEMDTDTFTQLVDDFRLDQDSIPEVKSQKFLNLQ
jgi:replicative DNA helicase